MEVLQVVAPAGEVKSQSPGEVLAYKAVQKELGDFPFPLQHILGEQEDFALFRVHLPHHPFKGVSRSGLVHPEIHQIQGIDDHSQIEAFRN